MRVSLKTVYSAVRDSENCWDHGYGKLIDSRFDKPFQQTTRNDMSGSPLFALDRKRQAG